MTQNLTAPDVLLVIATACPHCRAVLDNLTQLIKAGGIGKLEVVNVTSRPDVAEELSIRSVPWTRIGPFIFTGLLTLTEIRQWVEHTHNENGLGEYFKQQLTVGQISTVMDRVKERPEYLHILIKLFGDSEAGLQVRLGVDAILEELHGTQIAHSLVSELGELTRSGDPRTRADACHALRLTESDEAVHFLKACLDDENADVRETAVDTLEVLKA
jgi:thioredoxin-like negative regulator of GroEL